MTFVPGQRIRASALNQVGVLVARNTRTSNSSAINTTETRILSVRGAVESGRSYRVTLQTESFGSSADNAGQHALRYTTDDTEPTTSSSQMSRSLVNHALVAIPETANISTIYDAASSGYLRVAHTLIRGTGSGNVTISAGAAFPTVLMIEDIGPTIASSGTVY